MAATGSDFAMPSGPRPDVSSGSMIIIGSFSSWLGTSCWNEASQRSPTALVGQSIVFETSAASAYAFILRGNMPQPSTSAGIASSMIGVSSAVRVKPEPSPA
ncbi:hypothetical protein OY671_011659 [Metschnikowia pulcherrima]|nr:hypothetical protein OY671_011659 [Metschnikowia pulcherrima]